MEHSNKNKEYNKEWYLKNKEKIKERKRLFRLNNEEKIKERERLYFQKNKETIYERKRKNRLKNKDEINKRNREKYKSNKCQLEYYNKNKERIKEVQKQYRLKNKEKIKENQIKNYSKYKDKKREYVKQRLKNDEKFKMCLYLRNRIRDAIRNQNSEKAFTFIELLGCTIKEARDHLEKQFKEGMSWSNYGLYGWHIDHIIPCASFDLTDPEQQKKCFNYSNLQPLWAKDNLTKNAKILD
jgi:hypothetical protein